MKLSRRTKKRRYSKKSRRLNKKRKTTRKQLKRQNKKCRQNTRGGGKIFRGTDQGCSFWPSIYPPNEINDQTVTKVFYNKLLAQNNDLQREDAGYAVFDTYDPDCLFHARKISSGPCPTDILRDTLCGDDQSYTIGVPTTYINTEYVGTSLRTTQIRTKSFKVQLISFFINLLGLRNDGRCLIFRDLNGGNICYICDDATQECRFKCIDVGGVFELDANMRNIEPRNVGDISDQFSNIHYLVGEGLRNFNMRAFEYVPSMTYEDNLAIEIQKLQAALDYVTATEETVLFKNQIESTSSNISSRPTKTRKSMFFRGDSDSDEGPPLPSFKTSLNMFGDDDDGSPLSSVKQPSSRMFDSDED